MREHFTPEKCPDLRRNDTLLVKYLYLSDGMKTGARSISGEGLEYRGTMTFRRSAQGALTFESVPFVAGRMTGDGIRYYVTDHLGSVRAVLDGDTGNLLEASDYSAFGTQRQPQLPSLLTNQLNNSTPSMPFRYHFTGQEEQAGITSSLSLPYTDFGARHYSPSLSRWLVPDLMSEKYYDVSPYAYCANDPVNLVDPDGRVPRIYVQKTGLGHAFVTTGEGTNTVVYTYGRYGSLTPKTSFNITSGKWTPKGEGVLGILRGGEAESFLSHVLEEGNVSIYEIPGADEDAISSYFQERFDLGTPPTNEKKATYNNPSYQSIDNYSLLCNNCVTTTVQAFEKVGEQIGTNAISPRELDKDLFRQSLDGDKVQFVFHPIDDLNSLLKEFFYEKQ